MKTLGLTGGIGMGKSTAADILRRRGLSVVDSDDLARQIVEPGEPALEEIRQAFGDAVLDEQGRLRRDELASRIFADDNARLRLEAITHPRIRSLWQAQIEVWRAAGEARAVAVIPLLFETDAAGQFDAVVCVACTGATQLERLRARGWSDEQIQQRIRAQLPVERKMALSQHVIWTEGTLEVHEQQWERLLA